MTTVGALVVATTSYPTVGDGSESAGSFVRDLVDELSMYLRVNVVAPGASEDVEQQTGQVKVFRFKAPTTPLSTLALWRPTELVAIASVLIRGDLATRRAAADCAATHVFACWALPCGLWARRWARATGHGYSVWTLGSDIWSLGRMPVVRSILKRVLADARHCYSDGVKLAADTRRLSGGRDVQFLPSARSIECPRVESPRKQPPYRLLFIGRWHLNKGVDLLLESLALLEDGEWSQVSSVDIYGGGPLERLVREQIEGLRARGRPVTAHGFVDKREAQRIYLLSDFVLIPSRIESIPLVFSDAMKLGCPVIATPVGDLPDLINLAPRCGMCATEVSAEALKDIISAALACGPAAFAEGVASNAARFGIAAISNRIVSDLFG